MRFVKYTSRLPGLEPLEARVLLAADPVAAQFANVTAINGLNTVTGGSGEYHAGGAVFTDLTNDGYADLYTPGGSVFTGGLVNRLYVNVPDDLGGRTFTRVANDGGAGGTSSKTNGAVAADYDNDGDLDLYVINFQQDNVLYRNMWVEDHPAGGGSPTDLRFVDVTSLTDPTPANPVDDAQHGLGYATFQNPDPSFGNDRLDGSLAAAWADVNRDGFVDLYVGNWDGTNGDGGTARDGQLGERDTLYLNNGDGTFTDVTMGTATQAITPALLDDGSFESSVSGTQTSNSNWVMITNTPVSTGTDAVAFQDAPWASTSGGAGIWWRGFAGRPGDTAHGSLSQSIMAQVNGDYTLTFDANVEVNFTAAAMRVTLSSNGTGGSDTVELTTAAVNNTFLTYTLSMSGVTAGDQITVLVEMIDAAVPTGAASQSVLMDNFALHGPGGGWEQVGGWAFADGTYNDPGFPSEFAGLNAMQFADFNNDGWQDIIVATMGGGGSGPNRDMLYVNRGNDVSGDWLGFHLISWEIGFGGNDSGDMGVTVTDIDNDGDLDYYSTDGGTAHSVWLNQFADTGALTFVETFIPAVFAWGANFHDFDNNGRADLLIGTIANERPRLYMQDTDGVMHEQGAAAGLTTTNGHRGVVVADYDRDGFSDVFIQNIIKTGATPLGVELYHNESAALNPGFHYLNITLKGDPTLPGTLKSTRDAIGARVYVTTDLDGDGTIESGETRMEEVLSGHSQAASTSSLALEFGVGKATTADIRIVWGSGREHTMTVATDQFLVYNEGDLSALPGDLNGDGFVGITDLNIVLGNWNLGVPPADPLADPSGDGFVGIADLNVVLGNWNAGTPPVTPQNATSPAETASLTESTSISGGASLSEAARSSRKTRRAIKGNTESVSTPRERLAIWSASEIRFTTRPAATGYVPLSLRASSPDFRLNLWEDRLTE